MSQTDGNVERWEVSPSGKAGFVTLEIDGLFSFHLTPLQAIQMSSSLSIAAKATEAMEANS